MRVKSNPRAIGFLACVARACCCDLRDAVAEVRPGVRSMQAMNEVFAY